MRGGTHRTWALEIEIRHRTAERKPIFVGWRNLEMFPVTSKDRHRHYDTVPAFWQSFTAHCMLYLPSPSIIVYYSSAFGYSAPWFGLLLLEKTMAKLTIVSFVRLIQAAE